MTEDSSSQPIVCVDREGCHTHPLGCPDPRPIVCADCGGDCASPACEAAIERAQAERSAELHDPATCRICLAREEGPTDTSPTFPEFCPQMVPYRDTAHGCVEFVGHTGPCR
jgi:hypothetical protein